MTLDIKTFGSICSGIEAASFVLNPLGVGTAWLSEIDGFACRFLSTRYPSIRNLGDMDGIPALLDNGEIEAPDMLCGGTPCQAFSLAGWKNGLTDSRGQLTLKYIDILDRMDKRRVKSGKRRAAFFWENVEGVLTDKTNAFGCFLSGLTGLDEPINVSKWTSSGMLHGPIRNVAWRVLDAKYFGLPQQRRRIYVLGGDTDFFPENVLFEVGEHMEDPFKYKSNGCPSLFGPTIDVNLPTELEKTIGGTHFEIFRTYTDCLYAAYGTKWNGNAAAFNGSLFVTQDGGLRRLTPIECERLMGFPDDYTLIENCTLTNRYRAVGNSWAVNVIRWIMKRLLASDASTPLTKTDAQLTLLKDFTPQPNGAYINASYFPYECHIANFIDLLDDAPNPRLYISKTGCEGILRRKRERNAGMNARLEHVLNRICAR